MNRKPFIIAEAGINHNGDMRLAIDMVKYARNCGADAIKFQTFKAEEFIDDKSVLYSYKSQGVEISESMFEMFKRCELSRDEWFEIKEICDKSGIVFLSTPQNRSDLDLLLEIGVPAIKIGSDDFTNIPLIKDYASEKLPIILSIGMATLNEVRRTMAELSGLDITLLVCTSQYPCSLDDVNLLRFKTLVREFPGVRLGFSDHTIGSFAACVSIGLGSTMFEKHFTLSHDLPGPDHWFSADIDELKDWVTSIRRSWQSVFGAASSRENTSEHRVGGVRLPSVH